MIALTHVPGIGARTGRILLERFGSATTVFATPLKELAHVDGIGETRVKGFKDEEIWKAAEQEMKFVEKHGVTVYCINRNYPTRLANCADAPLVLFARGNVQPNTAKVVAIVGTRRNTDYGQKLCEELIEGLQQQEDITIVSGLALGIDAIAHKKSVALGLPTIGVLGHGLDKMYPPNHKELAEQMMEHGGVMSEFPSGSTAEKGNFPMRNRIVAGLSDVTVVVESQVSGGALITAAMAAGYNREVMAFPGRVNDSRSAGCNELIRTNAAAMITKAEDLLQLMNWDKHKKRKAVQPQLFLHLSAEEQKIVDALQAKEKVHADELMYGCGMAGSQLAATLLQLEMQGVIRSLPGKYYRLY